MTSKSKSIVLQGERISSEGIDSKGGARQSVWTAEESKSRFVSSIVRGASSGGTGGGSKSELE